MYTLQLLNDTEFDMLPYRDIETSLGIADSKTRQAFVRRTEFGPLDLFTIAHELEHLEDGRHGIHADHNRYGDGVYYKSFSDVFSQLTQGMGPQQARPINQIASQIQGMQGPPRMAGLQQGPGAIHLEHVVDRGGGYAHGHDEVLRVAELQRLQ